MISVTFSVGLSLFDSGVGSLISFLIVFLVTGNNFKKGRSLGSC